MEYRKLGRTGLKVSDLCLGSDNFGNRFGADPQTSHRILDKALGGGVNFIDTADSYADGNSEMVIGSYLRARRKRNDVVLATKFRSRTGGGPNDAGTSRYHVMQAIDDSLRRLQTDHVDLYLIHAPDPTTPLDETLEALTDLVRAGKVRYIGCSNFPTWILMRGLWLSDTRTLARFDCIQSGYNILSPGLSREMLPMCLEEGVGATAYSPMASGLLTGKHSRSGPPDDSKFGARDRVRGSVLMKRYWDDAKFDVVDRLKEVSKQSGQSMIRLALQWVRETPGITSTIIGARREEHIDGLLEAWSEAAPAEVMAEVRNIADEFAASSPMTYPPAISAP